MKYGKQYSQEKTLNILFRDGDLDEDLDYIPLPKELVKQLQDYRNSYKDFMTKKARDFTELVFNELSIKGILIKLFDSDEYGLRSTGIEDIMLDSNIEFFPIYLYYYMVGSFDFTEEDMRLLKLIMGEERFKRFMSGLDVFLGGSAWGKLPVIQDFIDLAKIPSSRSGSGWR